MFYKELGEILREGRKAASLSQNDVALRMGLTNQNISSWELGKSKIDMNQLQALCDMYGLDFSGVVVRAAKKTPADAAAGPHVPDEFAALLSRLNKAGRDELALYGPFLARFPGTKPRRAARIFPSMCRATAWSPISGTATAFLCSAT
jgi:transcriptional regulator with XRE-family HTH domain